MPGEPGVRIWEDSTGRAVFGSGPAPASPVPAVPSSRSGTPRRSSRRPRKISCSFSKCSEEAAEVAMAQAARERRPLRFRAQGPLTLQRSAAGSRSHHRDRRTRASRNQVLPGSSEPDALPLLSPRGRRAPKPDGKPGARTTPGYSRGAAPRGGRSAVSELETASRAGEVPRRRAPGGPRDGRLGRLIRAHRACGACWEL